VLSRTVGAAVRIEQGMLGLGVCQSNQVPDPARIQVMKCCEWIVLLERTFAILPSRTRMKAVATSSLSALSNNSGFI
jgi:hypothetical protein